MSEEHPVEPAEYERQLARYLQERIKPNLSSGAIPLLARGIAKEIASKKPRAGENGAVQENGAAPDFEADMHELQQELGDDWILCFSVRGEEGWLTAEKEDGSQRVNAPDAEGLVKIVEAIGEADAQD